MKREGTATRALWHLVSALGAAVFLAPLFFTVSMSLRPIDRPYPTRLELLPAQATLDNFGRALRDGNLLAYGANSLLVVAIAIPLTLLVASWAGLAIAHARPREQRALTAFALVALLVPQGLIWLPRFLLVKWLGLMDTPLALILPAFMGTSALFTLMFTWAFRRLPEGLLDAAALDGADALRVWWSVAMPVVGPTILAVTALCFISYWGDYIDPLLYLKTPARYTLPVGLSILQQADRTRWSIVMAGAALYALPPLAVFLAAQRFFLSSRRTLWLG